MLFELQRQYQDKFEEVKATRAKKLKSKCKNKYYPPTAKIKNKNGEQTPWSRLDCFDTYWSMQEKIRDLANREEMTPLEFEMHRLWR